jgi:hypothetical protein
MRDKKLNLEEDGVSYWWSVGEHKCQTSKENVSPSSLLWLFITKFSIWKTLIFHPSTFIHFGDYGFSTTTHISGHSSSTKLTNGLVNLHYRY